MGFQPQIVRIYLIKSGKFLFFIIVRVIVIDRYAIAVRAIIADYVLEQLPIAVHLSRNFDYHPGSLRADDIEDSFKRAAMVVLDTFQQAGLSGDKSIAVMRGTAEIGRASWR